MRLMFQKNSMEVKNCFTRNFTGENFTHLKLDSGQFDHPLRDTHFEHQKGL